MKKLVVLALVIVSLFALSGVASAEHKCVGGVGVCSFSMAAMPLR